MKKVWTEPLLSVFMDVGTILLVYQHNKKNYCCFNKILHKKDGEESEHNSLTSNKNTSENQRAVGSASHISSLLVLRKSSQITVSIFYSEDYENKF